IMKEKKDTQLDKNKIMDVIRVHKDKIKKFDVKRIGLFGSFVRNEQKGNSDIDFIVEFEYKKKNFDNFIELCFYLEELFGRKVDVLTKEGISKFIKPYIDKEVIYEELH
ncbi:MAG: nucleotidyltransferase family protein, partial [Methanosarcinales archaeon]